MMHVSKKLEELSTLMLRAIISEMFESDLINPLTKPSFFIRDSIQKDDNFMFEGEERWLSVIDDKNIFLPRMQM